MPPPLVIPANGSVPQGLSAAYESIAICNHRSAADKRYSLELSIHSRPVCQSHSLQIAIVPFQDALDFAKEYPAILGLGTFLVGLYFGNTQAIARDRRKEFNELSEEAFVALNKQIEQIKHGLPGQSVGDLLLINSYFPFYKRWLFRRHIEKYKNAQEGLSTYHVGNGSVTFNQEKMTQLGSSAKALLCYLKRR